MSIPSEQEDTRSTLKYEDLAAVPVPQVINAPATPLTKFQGFWTRATFIPGIVAMQQQFKAYPSDVVLATLPKCGTTWTKALIYAIMNRDCHPPSSSNHPLLTKNPHDCVPFLEHPFLPRPPSGADGGMDGSIGSSHQLTATQRLLSTHFACSMLPQSVLASGCRIVYVCRDTKDMLVSLWHFLEAAQGGEEISKGFPFHTAFEMCCAGILTFGPPWEHQLGYWEESLKRPNKILFLKYEEMMRDPTKNVTAVADFLGCPFSSVEKEGGVVEEVVKLCSFKKMKSLEVNQNGTQRGIRLRINNSSFFRKGEMGDWVNYMTPAMAQRLDGIIQQKLHGTGLAIAGTTPNHDSTNMG